MTSFTKKKEFIVNGEWLLEKKIGSGSFGMVFTAKNVVTGQLTVAKLEAANCQSPQLAQEYHLYNKLKTVEGLPQVYWYGRDGVNNEYNTLIMDRLGPSLENLFHYCKRRFSLSTVTNLAIQMIQRVRDVHKLRVMHRDIKPENFAMGSGMDSHKLYIIDFGLSKSFIHKKIHIPFKTRNGIVGSARYCSIHTHDGHEQSRRDDLISISYCLVYLLKGTLPWMGIDKKLQNSKFSATKDIKIAKNMSIFKNMPDHFREYMKYVSSLSFEEDPNYDFLLDGFIKLYIEDIKIKKFSYDWMAIESV